MAAPTVQRFLTTQGVQQTTGITVAYDTTPQNGEEMYVWLVIRELTNSDSNYPATSGPGSWTKDYSISHVTGTDPAGYLRHIELWHLTAGASEGNSYEFTGWGTGAGDRHKVRAYGFCLETGTEVHKQNSASDNTNPLNDTLSGSVTTTEADCLLIACVAAGHSVAIPQFYDDTASWTLDYEESDAGAGQDMRSIMASYSPGATGSYEFQTTAGTSGGSPTAFDCDQGALGMIVGFIYSPVGGTTPKGPLGWPMRGPLGGPVGP